MVISRAQLELARGRPRAALHALEPLRDSFRLWATATPGPIQWRPLAARAFAALDERDRAAELIEPELADCRAFGAARPLGIALQAAAAVHRGEDRRRLLKEAVAVLAASSARLEHGRALVDLGAALRHAGEGTGSRAPLSEGMASARACGATALARRAYDELHASGARPRKIVHSGVDALTASERRTAEMAGRGMANREIAQALFLTVATVETHLSRAYRKLGIGSRGQLAAKLGDGH